MHLIDAHPWAITGQATSTTASSWAWAHGQAGAMAMGGAVIVLGVMAAEGTTVEWAA